MEHEEVASNSVWEVISDAEFESTAKFFMSALLLKMLWIKVKKSSVPGLSQRVC